MRARDVRCREFLAWLVFCDCAPGANGTFNLGSSCWWRHDPTGGEAVKEPTARRRRRRPDGQLHRPRWQSRLPQWNVTSHADRHGHGYPSAPAMQRSGGADLTAAYTVSHERLSSKHYEQPRRARLAAGSGVTGQSLDCDLGVLGGTGGIAAVLLRGGDEYVTRAELRPAKRGLRGRRAPGGRSPLP